MINQDLYINVHEFTKVNKFMLSLIYFWLVLLSVGELAIFILLYCLMDWLLEQGLLL